jgi:hypothetical protein
MKKVLFVALGFLGIVTAQTNTITVPREKIGLVCTDSYFKTERKNFVLQDETYPTCKLLLPLALRERWGGQRKFYVVPRVSANLYARDEKGKGQWLPLTPLVNLGEDLVHRVIPSNGYKYLELIGEFGKLSDRAGTLKPDTIGAGGKVTVCAAPIYRGEQPCVTFEVTARFRVYSR